MAFNHNNKTIENEPTWGSVDKTKLPRKAHAIMGDAALKTTWKYPHHGVLNGGGLDDKGVYTTGTMYLHRGGVIAAYQRAVQQNNTAAISHLTPHRKALGLGDIQKSIQIAKANAELRVVYGVVYEPNSMDSDGDWASAATIQRAAHGFLMEWGFVGVQHSPESIMKAKDISVVESFLFPFDGMLGEQSIKQGSWILGVKIHDDYIWEQVMNGELTGFSMHGEAVL